MLRKSRGRSWRSSIAPNRSRCRLSRWLLSVLKVVSAAHGAEEHRRPEPIAISGVDPVRIRAGRAGVSAPGSPGRDENLLRGWRRGGDTNTASRCSQQGGFHPGTTAGHGAVGVGSGRCRRRSRSPNRARGRIAALRRVWLLTPMSPAPVERPGVGSLEPVPRREAFRALPAQLAVRPLSQRLSHHGSWPARRPRKLIRAVST